MTNKNKQIFIVGGYVRDTLMNKKPHDIDYCAIGYSPEDMINLGYQKVGKDFNVFLDEKGDEYALPRGHNIKTDPVSILKEDLKHRDITINSMAFDEKGNLVDPFNGKEDIENKILRHTGDSFKEDPIRILRLARFYAQFEDFSVSEETKEFVKNFVLEGALVSFAPERVFAETKKALETDNSRKYFEFLEETGALYYIMPEVALLKGIPQPKEHHPEIDSFTHTMLVLEQATSLSKNPVVRFGALTHDVGKILTHKALWPKHIGHEKNGVPLVTNLCKRIKAPNDYRKTAEKACENHMKIHMTKEMTDKKINKIFVSIGKKQLELLNNIALISKADARGRLGFEKTPYIEYDTIVAAYKNWDTVSLKDEVDSLGMDIKELNINQIKQIEHNARLSKIKIARQNILTNKLKKKP